MMNLPNHNDSRVVTSTESTSRAESGDEQTQPSGEMSAGEGQGEQGKKKPAKAEVAKPAAVDPDAPRGVWIRHTTLQRPGGPPARTYQDS